MSYTFEEINTVAAELQQYFDECEDKTLVLKDKRLAQLMAKIKDQPNDKKAAYGQEINTLKKEIQAKVAKWKQKQNRPEKKPVDVTAPMDENSPMPSLLSSAVGSVHPIMAAQDEMMDIFERMGFRVVESRQLDDDYHMFGSLNFPEGHPARDEYDTFVLDVNDANGRPLVAPAHTSNMQNRVLKAGKEGLENNDLLQ